eukprot:969898-Pyramimonas_sp.AAC.1
MVSHSRRAGRPQRVSYDVFPPPKPIPPPTPPRTSRRRQAQAYWRECVTQVSIPRTPRTLPSSSSQLAGLALEVPKAGAGRRRLDKRKMQDKRCCCWQHDVDQPDPLPPHAQRKEI